MSEVRRKLRAGIAGEAQAPAQGGAAAQLEPGIAEQRVAALLLVEAVADDAGEKAGVGGAIARVHPAIAVDIEIGPEIEIGGVEQGLAVVMRADNEAERAAVVMGEAQLLLHLRAAIGVGDFKRAGGAAVGVLGDVEAALVPSGHAGQGERVGQPERAGERGGPCPHVAARGVVRFHLAQAEPGAEVAAALSIGLIDARADAVCAGVGIVGVVGGILQAGGEAQGEVGGVRGLPAERAA